MPIASKETEQVIGDAVITAFPVQLFTISIAAGEMWG